MWLWKLRIYVHIHLLFSFAWDMNTWCIYIAWRVLVNRVWRASTQICDMVPSVTLWFLREHSGSFGDTLVPSGTLWSFRGQYGSFGNTLVLSGTIWFLREHSDGGMGWTSAVHRGGLRCIWDSRPPYCSWYIIWSLSGSVCDSRSCQAIQYT